MRGFIKKEVSMKNISEMWPKFLLWVDEYVGCGINGSAKAQYSREDMRYAYQAGYELSKWISVEDKLPETDGVGHEYVEVLVAVKLNEAYHEVKVVTYFFDEDGFNVLPVNEVTHWQPLPEPPK